MKLFVILFEQRSGSSHLVSLLNSHREIRARGEVFDANKTLAEASTCLKPRIWAGFDVDNDPLYRRKITVDGQTHKDPNKRQCVALVKSWIDDPDFISGFKFKFPKQAKLFPEVDNCLHEVNDKVRFIVLRRDNLVRRALSHFNHKQIQDQIGKSNFRGSGQILKPIRLDLDRFVQFVNHLKSLRRQFLDWANSFSKTLHVDYEELLNNPMILERIQKFIGVNQLRQLKSNVVKATSTQLEQAITNYDQFEDRMVAEGMQSYLNRAA